MEPTKWIMRTRTFLGGLIAALPGISSAIGLEIEPTTWTDLDGAVGIAADAANEVIGLVMIAYGRIKAAFDARPVTLMPGA